MAVAKGYIKDDYTYVYTCGNCLGAGSFPEDGICSHCYNLDYDRLLIEFKTARGSRYYALLKAILSIKGKAIADRSLEIKAQNGKVVVADLIHMLVEFQFPRNRLKPLVEWLEECRLAPTGLYTRIQESKWTIKQALVDLGYADYDC